jgi:hypothetical protein
VPHFLIASILFICPPLPHSKPMFHNLNICAVALSSASLTFSSHMLYSICAGQGRTYYLAARRPTSGPTLSATTSPPCPRRPVSTLVCCMVAYVGCCLSWWLQYVAPRPHSACFLCSALCRPDRRCERLRGTERHDEQRHGHEEHYGKSGTSLQSLCFHVAL